MVLYINYQGHRHERGLLGLKGLVDVIEMVITLSTIQEPTSMSINISNDTKQHTNR